MQKDSRRHSVMRVPAAENMQGERRLESLLFLGIFFFIKDGAAPELFGFGYITLVALTAPGNVEQWADVKAYSSCLRNEICLFHLN